MRTVTAAADHRSSATLDLDHARIRRLIARHRSAKANGDDQGAQVALRQAEQALEAHLAAMRQAPR